MFLAFQYIYFDIDINVNRLCFAAVIVKWLGCICFCLVVLSSMFSAIFIIQLVCPSLSFSSSIFRWEKIVEESSFPYDGPYTTRI